jgi:VanZ family protein
MRSRRSVALWVGAIAYAAAIFVSSSQPVPPRAEGAVVAVGDEVLHGLAYAGLAALLALAIASTVSPRVRSYAALIALAGAVGYAASDEFHQTLVPGRKGDVMDFAADAVGALLASVVYEGWRRWTLRGGAVSGTSPR